MKKLSKIVSVVLSLALCLGMASPAFAASFSQLQEAINGGAGDSEDNRITAEDGSTRYGYGWNEDEKRWGVEAWDSTTTSTTTDDDGNEVETTTTTRNVQLKEDVDFQTGDTGIVIDGNKTGQQNVTINMDGHTIDANPGAVLNAKNEEELDGKFYQATTDENGNKVAVTNDEGKKIEATGLNNVKILNVQHGANVTVNGEGGTLTGGASNAKGAAAYITDGSNVTMNNVNITGNRGSGHGGAVHVGGESTFEMNDGSLTNNYSGGHGGGLGAFQAESVTLNDVDISNNATASNGGGVWLSRVKTATVDNCTITGNYAKTNGGGMYVISGGECNILNTTITENKNAGWGGGAIYFDSGTAATSTLNLQGNNLISQNESTFSGGGIFAAGKTVLNVTGNGNILYGNTANIFWGADLVLDSGVVVSGMHRINQGVELKDEEGHVLSGWYDDSADSRWEEGKVATAAPEYIFADEKNEDGTDKGIAITGTNRTCLKFAHNKFYDVKVDVNHDGIEEQTVKTDAEMKNTAGLVIETPAREGYTFLGWDYSENVQINDDGTIDSTDGNDIKLTAKWEINRYTATFTDPDGGNTFDPAEVEYNNPFTAPADPTREGYTFDGWTLPDGTPFDFSTPATGNIELTAKWTAVNNGGNGDDDNGGGTTIPDADVPLAGDPGADTATIADQEVPLAALFTRADAIGYLWEQSGSPEAELSDFPDVPEDHRWAVAIGWAQDAGIALPDEDGNFRPDDLVLRASSEPEGELQEFLNRYAVYAGIELDEGELFIVLEGAADDIIMGADAQVIFDSFFAKLEAALQEKAA